MALVVETFLFFYSFYSFYSHSRRILTLRLIFKEEEATSVLAGFRQVLALIELKFGHVGF